MNSMKGASYFLFYLESRKDKGNKGSKQTE